VLPSSENLSRYVEDLNDARTLHGEKRVSARRGWAGEKSDVFSHLLVYCRHDDSSRIMAQTTMSELPSSAPDHTLAIREEFRHHLETFYAQLKLAPPYESVEKAVRSLTTSIHALPPLERARLTTDATARWQHFRQAFQSSGLSKKHRGIIAGLARNRSNLNLLPEYDHFLSLYLS